MANEFKIKKGLIVTGASGGTVVDIQGSQGQLFSVTDDLSGSIFAVSDISGVPILDVNSSGLSTFSDNVVIGSVDSVVTGLNIGEASPTIQLFDTTNDGKLLMYMQDSSAVIGTYSNHSLNFFSDSTLALTIDISQNAIFEGNLDVNGTGNNTFTGNIIMDNAAPILQTNSSNNASGFRINVTGIADSTNSLLRVQRSGTTMIDTRGNGNTTFTAQAFSAATSSGDASSTLTTKGYVDGLITGATIYRGTWDPDVSLNSGYGNPNLNTVTQTSGYYYICSADGAATPNGTGTEPDSWNTGDWVIWNDDIGASGEWQKIDNSSVLSGVGTGQTVALWQGASSVTDSETLGNSLITQSGDVITIGSSSVSQLALNSIANNDSVIYFKQVGTNKAKIGYDHSEDALAFIHGSGNFSTAGMVLDGTGVGIGTTSPSVQLDIEDSSNVIVDMNTTTANANTTIRLQESGSVKATIGYDGTNDGLILTTGGFTAGNGIFINDSQNVGIGTDDPTNLLHIKKTGFTRGTFEADGDNQVGVQIIRTNSSNNTNWEIYSPAASTDLRFFNGGDRLTISSSGAIGIGGANYGSSGQVLTSNGNAAPSWQTPTTGTVKGTGTATRVAFWSASDTISSSDDLYWDNTIGGLGINDTTPNARLKVTSGTSDTSFYTVDINHVRNDANVATHAMRLNVDLSGADTTTADRTNSGLFIDIDSSASGDASDEHRIYGVNSTINFTGFSDLVRGGYFLAESNYTGAKTSQLVGVYGQANHDAGSTNGGVSNMMGVYGYSSIQDLGDVDNAFGGYFLVSISTNRGAADVGVTKAVEGEITIDKDVAINYGTMIGVSSVIDNNEGSTPNFGNQYLFKGDYQGDKGGNAYGIYVEGDKHYFSGNVGIGTTAPDARLHAVSANLGETNNDTTTQAIFQASNGNTSKLYIQDYRTIDGTDWTSSGKRIQEKIDSTWMGYMQFNGDVNNGGISFGTGQNTTQGNIAERMRIDSSGNVGIGTTLPTNLLTINDPNANGSITDTIPSWWGLVIDRAYTTSSSAAIGVIGGTVATGSSGRLYLGNSDDVENSYIDGGANQLHFSVGGEKMRINSSGNVGIGTTNPANYKLEVNGNVKGDSFGTDESTTARIFSPSGAAYNGSGSQTGYLIMELPDNGTSGVNNMMSGVIRVFDYTFGESFDVHFAGYWYSGYNWTNCTAFVINEPGVERNFNIRFGSGTGSAGANTRPYIAIGEATSTWTYCKFSVTEYTSGHSNAALYKWNSGWAASLSATLPGSALRTVTNTQTNNWKRSNNDLYSGNSGNVGIGTSTPDAKFNVTDGGTQVTISGTYLAHLQSESNCGLAITAGTSSNNYIAFGDINSYDEGIIAYNNSTRSFLFRTAGGALDDLVIDSVGNVGIGTTSPDYHLEIENVSSPTIALKDTTNNVITKMFSANSQGFVGTESNHDLRIRTNNTDKLTILSGGNVGIGTTAPNAKLDIQGTQGQLFSVTDDLSGSIFAVSDISGVPIFDVNSSGVSYFDGDVGIGTTSPGTFLQLGTYNTSGKYINQATYPDVPSEHMMHITAPSTFSYYGGGISFGETAFTAANIVVRDAGASGALDLCFGTGTASGVTEKMRIANNGYVGIGTTSPSQRLHVVGNARVTGAYYDSNNSAGTSGQVLSSTASGTDWVDVLTGSGTSGVLPKWNSAGTALIDSGLSFPIGSSYADFVLGAGGTTTVRFIGNASQTGDFSIKNTTGDIRLQANNTTATTAKFTSSDITLGENTFVQGSLRVEGSVQADLYIGNIFGPSDTNTGYRINHSSLGCFIDVRNDVDKITYRDYPNATGTINSKFEMNMSSGNFTATGNIIAFGTISDRKLKENIKPIDSALDKAMRLQGVTFNWKKSDSILEIGEDIGFIAQDVQKVLPELVRENKNGEFSLRHQGITPILLEAIKELKAEIEELKKQIK